MGDSDELFDADEFLFTEPVWFISPIGARDDLEALAKVAQRIRADSGRELPVAFTDVDLANDFIEAQGADDRLEAFVFENVIAFVSFLAFLAGEGYSSLAVDPYSGRHRVVKTTDIIEGIRRRLG